MAGKPKRITNRPASAQKVERLETDIKNLQLALAAQSELIVDLRNRVTPIDRYTAVDAQSIARALNGSPAVRNGTRVSLG